MAGDFTMAGLAMMRVQKGDIFGNVKVSSPPRVNNGQARLVPEGVTRVALSHTKKAFHRVLASPHRIKHLALKGFYIDENQVIRKGVNFNSTPMTPKQKAHSVNPSTPSSPSTGAPAATAVVDIASTCDALSPASVTGVASPCDSPYPASFTGVASARETPAGFDEYLYTAGCTNMTSSPLEGSDPVSLISKLLLSCVRRRNGTISRVLYTLLHCSLSGLTAEFSEHGFD
jgi:hypothetical protein